MERARTRTLASAKRNPAAQAGQKSLLLILPSGLFIAASIHFPNHPCNFFPLQAGSLRTQFRQRTRWRSRVCPTAGGIRWNRAPAPGILTARRRANLNISPLPPQVRCVFRRDSGSLTLDVPPSETTRWRAVARVLRSPLDSLGCALLPAFCTLCGSPLPQLASAPICAICWAEIPLQTGSACARCGDALDPLGVETGRCRACRLAPPPFVRAVHFGLYEHRMRAAIHVLKYDRIHSAAHGLGLMLAQGIAQLAAEAPSEMLVVPVPLHRSKYAERGFNQARSLAVQAIAALRKSHPAWRLTLASSTLMRLRATDSQAGLTSRQRRLNVRGAFSVSDPQAVTLKHILVIDDILTTGATARAAATALLKAGAVSVWVATLARARRAAMPVSGQVREAEIRRAGHPLSIGTLGQFTAPAGAAPSAALHEESIHSSHHKPSF